MVKCQLSQLHDNVIKGKCTHLAQLRHDFEKGGDDAEKKEEEKDNVCAYLKQRHRCSQSIAFDFSSSYEIVHVASTNMTRSLRKIKGR